MNMTVFCNRKIPNLKDLSNSHINQQIFIKQTFYIPGVFLRPCIHWSISVRHFLRLGLITS